MLRMRSVGIANDSIKQATCCGRCQCIQPPAAAAAIATAVRRSMMHVQEAGLLVWAESVNHGCDLWDAAAEYAAKVHLIFSITVHR